MWRGFLLGLFLAGGSFGQDIAGATYQADRGVVRALDGDRVIWENVHDRRGIFRHEKEPGRLTTPALMDADTVVYAIGCHVFQADADTGRIRARTVLPGLCVGLKEDGGRIAVDVQFAVSGVDPWRETYVIGPDSPPIPFFLSSRLGAALMTQRDAESVLTQIQPSQSTPDSDDENVAGPTQVDRSVTLEMAIDELDRLGRWDPTNPWYHYFRGCYLQELGRNEEAEAAYDAVFDIEPAYDFELLTMAKELDAVSPEIGDRAFSRGMTCIMNRGYEPEMTSALLTVMVHLGKFGSPDGDPKDDLARYERLGQRLWDFAPFVEWSTGMYQALADAHRDAGNTAKAAIWQERAQRAFPFRHFGFGTWCADHSGLALNVIIASWMALILALILKTVRTLFSQVQSTSRWRWNPFCFWTRGEIIGFLLVQLLLASGWFVANRGLSFIGHASALPLTALSGNFGHPESVAYLKRFADTDGGRFVYALALQKAKRLDEAASLYQSLSSARAKNNLGVIRHQMGHAAEAKALFEAALDADAQLHEAAFNLGRTASGSRIERAEKYGIQGPLYAMPTRQQWGQALTGRFRASALSEAFSVQHTIKSAELDQGVLRAAAPVSANLVFLFFLALAVCAILGLMFRPDARPKSPSPLANLLGWVLGFVLPGVARQWHLLGVPLLALSFFAGLAAIFLNQSGGLATNVLDAVAKPSLEGVFGLWTLMVTPMERIMRTIGHWWWMIWVVNLGAVIFFEVIAPDPWGPKKKTTQ